MKITATWLVIASCIAVSPVAPARSASRDEAGIRGLLDRWRKAFHYQDLAGVMSIYPRGTALVAYDIIPPLQYKGWDAYQADYQAFFDQYEGPIDIEDRAITIIADGSVGYSYCLERISGALKGGKSPRYGPA